MRAVEKRRNVYLVIRLDMVQTDVDKDMVFEVLVLDGKFAQEIFQYIFVYLLFLMDNLIFLHYILLMESE